MMTANGTDHRPAANTEPCLLRIKVNGKACYAFKWHDERVATRREVNYVMRDPIAGVVQCLLVNCPLRIAGSPELVSVQSTGRSLVHDGPVWEFAETVWQCGETDDEGTIRFCPPAQFPDRSLRTDLNRMIREYNEGKRKCDDLTIPPPAPSAIAPEKAIVTPARAAETDLTTIASQAAEMAAEKVRKQMVVEDARRQAEDRAQTADKNHLAMRKGERSGRAALSSAKRTDQKTTAVERSEIAKLRKEVAALNMNHETRLNFTKGKGTKRERFLETVLTAKERQPDSDVHEILKNLAKAELLRVAQGKGAQWIRKQEATGYWKTYCSVPPDRLHFEIADVGKVKESLRKLYERASEEHKTKMKHAKL